MFHLQRKPYGGWMEKIGELSLAATLIIFFIILDKKQHRGDD